MQILVNTLDGKIVVLAAFEDEKIGDVKKKFKLLYDVYFIFQGEVLYDDRTVGDCEISNNSMIYLHLPLRLSMHLGQWSFFIIHV